MLIETLGLGVDSLVACLAVAPLISPAGVRPSRVQLAAVLGAGDGAATLAASVGGFALYGFAAAIAATVLMLAVRWPGYRRLCVLPLVLSIDNLAVPLAPGDAAFAAATSSAMGLLGFALSSLVFRIIPKRMHKPTAIAIAGGALLTITLV